MDRDREATRSKLLAAAERLIVRGGVAACGVNAIAQEAGVDKVLIYRYFGGAAELIQAVVSARGAWPNDAGAASSAAGTAGAALAAALVTQARDVRSRPVARRALAWEAAGQSTPDLGAALGREPAAAKLLATLRSRYALPAHLDLEAVTALLAAGLTALAVRADAPQPFFGLDATDDADWRRVERAAQMVLRTMLDPSDV